MKLLTHTAQFFPFLLVVPTFLLLPGSWKAALAQEISATNNWRDSVLPRDAGWLYAQPGPEGSALNRSPRSWLFRMPSPQSCGILGLDADPDPPADDPGACAALKSNEWSRCQVFLGSDHPFLDLRRPGDPGGAGYYKLYSQVSLLDTSTNGLSMGLQAVTPAGLDADGVGSGPTILSPDLAWSWDLSPDTAVHAFIGKDLRANWHSTRRLGHPQYGIALETGWPFTQNNSSSGASLFVEALRRPFVTAGQHSLENMDLLPGIHWRLSERWWMTSGVLMPVAAPRLDASQLQITCSWQF